MPVIASDPHTVRPRRTLRLRLTLLYGTLFLVSGTALLAITYGLLAQTLDPKSQGGAVRIASALPNTQIIDPPIAGTTGPDGTTIQEYTKAVVVASKAAYLQQLLVVSGIALLLMAALSVALGWWISGRALRPVREMTGKARRLSEANLHERLDVTGPNDELKDLGDTFDGLLARLDTAFEAQKRFVANASHELRTPLTLQRAMIEVALADPNADAESLRRVCQRVLAAGDVQANLIEALLTLARSQRGLDSWEPLNLGSITADLLRERRPAEGLRLEYSLAAAWTTGDARLVERLVTNLVDNAVRHNVPDGWVTVTTGTVAGRPSIRVANSGQRIPGDHVGTLFQPFARLESRTSHEGNGLGLSIVSAIATAHGATISALSLPDGGLAVTVGFQPTHYATYEPVHELEPVAAP